MLLFLVTGLSFLLFFKSLIPLNPLPPWTSDVRFLPLCFWKHLSFSPIGKPIKKKIFLGFSSTVDVGMKKQVSSGTKLDNSKETDRQISVLDLPELALDCILEKLPPSGLCSMAGVCCSLRERCTSDHFWVRHMNQKWGPILGPAAYTQWQCFVSSKKNSINSEARKPLCLIKLILHMWPLSWVSSKFHKPNKEETTSSLDDSVMSFYLALESAKFWFSAQVYNRENGHVGFMLSCYDAELSYDHQTDTFQARYPPHGSRAIAIESGVSWERLRATPVATSPRHLHVSDCLHDLHPGDHIEIQWRRNKEFPYGWWYGVVGHLESCDGDDNYCRCHTSDTVVLEFNHYTPGSRWRRTVINRKDHRETGTETEGFYGGIRKLYRTDEIATWKRLWPRDILQ